MKKSTIVLSLLALSLLIVFSCKKDDSSEKTTISGSIAEFKFNQESDLDTWSFSSNDSAFMLIDYDHKVEGAGSLKIQDGCSSIINQSGTSIQKSENYKITVSVKYNEFESNWSCGGAYNLVLVVIQGSEMEWFSLYHENNEWYDMEFYYKSHENGLPVQFRVSNGMKDLWIDNMVMEITD